MSTKPGPIVLVAGEASGDGLAAGLITALLQKRPKLRFAGIGGPRMADAGMEIWFDADELAIMGLSEVVAHLPRLLKMRQAVHRRAVAEGSPLLIGVDAPDFNLGLERRVRAAGVRTVHYVSPSIWAWRQNRARTIGRCAELVLTLFPFEPALYERFGVPARFVGHPLADRIPLQPDRRGARKILGLPSDETVVALLPGSRRSEVTRLGPIIAEAAGLLAQERKLVFAIPAASRPVRDLIEQTMRGGPAVRVEIFDGRSETVLTAADLAIIASGTAALEALLTKTPMVVVYRVSSITYWIVTFFRLMKVDRYSLPNKLAGARLVDEIMQDDLTPENLARAVVALFDDSGRREAMVRRFSEIHAQLRCGADRQAADAVLQILEDQA